jgi:hypothetical protein
LDDFEAIVGLDFGRGKLPRKERDIVVLDKDRLAGKAESAEQGGDGLARGDVRDDAVEAEGGGQCAHGFAVEI